MPSDPEETSLVKESAEVDTYSGHHKRPGDRRPALVFLRGELLAVPIPLERSEVTMGRALDADIRVNDSRASRLHARISTEPNAETGEIRYRLTDLDSTNGTILNGKPITQEFLQDGDKFEVGDQLIRFEMLDEIDREFQQQIHRLLVHDELTGLLTGKSFFSELRREAARSASESMPFCVLIKQTLRAGDVGARFGGEEFAAFLLDADYAQGLVAAERVRVAIEKHEFSAVRKGSAEPARTHRITISVGVASYPIDGSDPIQLVELADSALYRAKRSGRNCVCAYRPAGTTEVLRLRPRVEA